MNNMF